MESWDSRQDMFQAAMGELRSIFDVKRTVAGLRILLDRPTCLENKAIAQILQNAQRGLDIGNADPAGIAFVSDQQ
jgi:hypothetical protein